MSATGKAVCKSLKQGFIIYLFCTLQVYAIMVREIHLLLSLLITVTV